MHRLLLRSCLVLLLVGSASARAQDVDTFNLSGSMFDRQGTLQLTSPFIGEAKAWYAGGGLVYADSPLVVEFEDGSEEEVVASQLSTRLMGGYNLMGKARLDLEIPVYPSVRVAEELGVGAEAQTFDGQFALGDLRLGATVPVLGDEDGVFGVAVTPYLELPTGSVEAYVANGGVAGGLRAAVGGLAGPLGWNANLGVGLGRAAEIDETLSLGNNLNTGVGVNYLITDTVLAGGELTALLPFVDGFDPWNKKDVEAHLYGTWLGEGGLVGTLGLGSGLLAGVGAPDFRVVLALAYAPVGPFDRDGDGIVDDVDRCPDDPEDKDSFEDVDGCPDPDNDKDGILDAADSCPNDPEDKDQFEDADGCPDPDNDKDTVLDVVDACPLEAGPVETKGCPDTDHDRVPNFRDKCPNEPIDPRADPELSDGCPTKAVLTRKEIVILDKVYFDFDKATIKPESFGLLSDVAKIINDNPQIKLIEVGGHTDDQGADAYNKKLSQSRVEAVVDYLVKVGGVDRGRLSAVGYGETVPIAPNTDEVGRAENRRVEFKILQQDTQME